MRKMLLPQDIHLLTTKWADPEHFPSDEAIGPLAWRKQYQQRLEQTIAEWLTKGLVAYQYPQRRIDAFVPISHLVGTSKDSISFIDSLADIAHELEVVRDPKYRPHPNEAFQQDNFVVLGECFAGGIARSAEKLAHRLGEDESPLEQCFQGLLDVLTLIQAVKPHNAGSVLYATWSELNRGKAKIRFKEISRVHPWVVEHAFILACYPVCNIATGKDIRSVLDDLKKGIQRSAPNVVKVDLEACYRLISVDKQILADRIFVDSGRSQSNGSPPVGKQYPTLMPRHRYQSAGVCYAR